MRKLRSLFPTSLVQAGVVAAGLLLGTGAATASPIEVRDGTGGNVFDGGPGYVALTVQIDGASRSTVAGAFALQYRQSGSDPWSNFLTYCLEPDEPLGISGTTPVSGDLRGAIGDTAEYAGRGAAITGLWNTWFAHSLTSATNSAAFQVALWEIAYDGTGGLNSGSFAYTAAGAVLTQALAYLDSANWNSPVGDQPSVILRVGNQDLVVTIPEPSTLAVFGLGLIGLAMAARRRAAQG